jgi:AsmA protein
MRRILTTLMILLAVVVAGLTALVLLVNPNDFRAYMVHKVAERSGYQLELDGPLRWHVWPQLSILSGRMTLTAPGAEEPVMRADNMRLDVALLPLISHQLQVKQVMLKGAVIQLTPKTEAVRGRMRRWCRMTIRCRWWRRTRLVLRCAAAAGGRQRALFPA